MHCLYSSCLSCIHHRCFCTVYFCHTLFQMKCQRHVLNIHWTDYLFIKWHERDVRFVKVMPYASGASVRRLSKIATLLLAKNYIVMLQRTVDELRRLTVQCERGSSCMSSSLAAKYDQPALNSHIHDGAARSSPAVAGSSAANQQVFTPNNLDIVLQTHNVELSMMSFPPSMVNEQVKSHLLIRQRQGVGSAFACTSTPAGLQRHVCEEAHSRCGVPSATLIPGTVAVSIRNRHRLPWIDRATGMPLMTAGHQQSLQATPAAHNYAEELFGLFEKATSYKYHHDKLTDDTA